MQQLPILTIDLCTSKIISIAAKQSSNNQITVLAVGYSSAAGIKKGKITNMDLATLSIKQSMDNLRQMYSGEFAKIYVNIPSVSAQTYNSKAMVNVPSGKISTKEIKTVLKTAIHNTAISSDYEILHAIANNFIIDGSFIQDPQSYITNHLEAKANIIAVSKNYLNNIRQALRDYGFDSLNFVVNSYVAGQALSNANSDEHYNFQNGHLVIDIGSSCTYASIYKGKSCVFSKFYPIGGNNISKDIALMLNTKIEDANTFKENHASIIVNDDEAKQKVRFPNATNDNSFTEVSAEYLSTIIHCRLEELFYLIKDDIEEHNMFNAFKSGIILSGGSSKIEGIKKLCFKIFENQRVVKLDTGLVLPNDYFDLKDPRYSTAVALVKYALDTNPHYEIDSTKNLRAKQEVIEPPKPSPSIIPQKPTPPKRQTGDTQSNESSHKQGFLKKIIGLLDKHL